MDEEEAFERGLMAYVRGELDTAAAEMQAALRGDPHDRRARDLLQAIRGEQGQGLSDAAAPSPPQVPSPVSPQQILHLVKTQNPQVRRTIFQVIEARARLREANVSISPELVLLARIYPLGFFTSLTQSLYGGLVERRARMSEAEQMIVDAVADYAHTRNEVLARALNAYIDARRTHAAQHHFGEWERIQSERVRVAQVQSDFAKTLPDEPLEQYADLSEFRQRTLRADKELILAKVTLNGLMGRAMGAPLDLAPVEFEADLPTDVYRMVELARGQRYDFRQTAARVAQARAHREVVRASTPDLDLRASYGLRDRDTTDTFQRGGSLAAILRLPLLIGPLKHAQLDREEAIIGQLEMDHASLSARMSEEVVKAHGAYELARGRQRVALGNAFAQLESLRIAQARDRWVGDVDLLRLEGERLRWEQAHEEITAADYDLQHALVDLYRAMGRDLEELAARSVRASDRRPVTDRLSTRGRALWVWRPEFLYSQVERAFFFDFAAARRIHTVFLYSPGLLDHRSQVLREFLRDAHARGIEVHALHGEPDWFLDDKQGRVAAFISAVKKFNDRAGEGERFDALHLDVEPHTLAAWAKADPGPARQHLLEQYVSFVKAVAGELGGRLALVVDLPVRYSGVDDGAQAVLKEILPHVEGVALMAYRSGSARVVAAADPLLRQAQTAGVGVRFWVGVSADPTHLCGPMVDGDFEAMMREVDEGLAKYDVLQGVAVHEYDRYRKLVTDSAPPRERAGGGCAEYVDKDVRDTPPG
ncbi:MAG: TolC family protein [Chromatiales bacterium]